MARSSTAPATATMTSVGFGSGQPQRKSLWIPALFVGLMLVVVVVNGIMIFFAEDTFSGLDTENAYQAGNSYNETLKEAAASAALGWSATVAFAPVAGGRHVTVTVTDKSGKPVTGLALQGHLVRPISTAFDRVLTLRPEGSGIYGADIDLPMGGSWELRLSAQSGSVDWQTVQRVFVK